MARPTRDVVRGQRVGGAYIAPRGSGAGRVASPSGGGTAGIGRIAGPGNVGVPRGRIFNVAAGGSFGLRALAGSFNQLAGAAERVMNQQFAERAKAVEREQSLAGAQYGLGVELDQLQLPAGDSIGDEAFRRSAILATRAKVDLATYTDVEELAKQHPGKPEQFREALTERAKAFVSKLPPELQPDAAIGYARLGQQRYLALDDERRQFERDQNRAAILKATEIHGTAAARAARFGDWAGAEEELGKLAEMTSAAGPVELGGSGALSLVEIEKTTSAANEEIRGQLVEGWAERAQNPYRALEGLRAGKTGDPNVDAAIGLLGPDTTAAIGNRLEAEIKHREAEAKRAAAEARAEQRERLQELRFQAGMVVDNEEAAAELGTTASPGWESVVRAAYGDRAQPVIDRVNSRRETAIIAADLSTMPTADIGAVLEGRVPEGEGFAYEARDFQALQRAAEKVIATRLKDPAAEALRAFPTIGAALSQGTTIGAALRETDRVQREVFGLAPGQVRLLTNEQAGAVVEGFKGAVTADERIGLLQQYVSPDNDDALNRRLLSQLEDKGLPADARFALERFRDGDIAGARDILAGVTTDPKDLPKLGETAAKDVEAAVDARMGGGTVAAMTTRLANMSQEPGLYRRSAAERNTMQRLAQQYAAAGDDPDTAAAKAEKAVFGDKLTAGSDDLGFVTIPSTADPDAVTDALERARATVDLSWLAPTFQPRTGEEEGQRFQADRDFDAYVEQMRDSAIWAESENGYILLDPTDRARILGYYTLDQLLATPAAPAAAPGPLSSLPAGSDIRSRASATPSSDAAAIGDDLSGGAGLDRLAPGVGGTLTIPVNPSPSEILRRLAGRSLARNQAPIPAGADRDVARAFGLIPPEPNPPGS